jgi:tryptophanyl-tRNA synthetase
MTMFTDPTRIKRADPGHPESCNLFAFHRLVSPPELMASVERDCRAATIGCVDDKRLIADQIIAFLDPIRRRREELMRDPGALFELIVRGTERARARARETMAKVRAAIGMDYGLVDPRRAS